MSNERLVELIGDAPIGVNGITLLDKHEPKAIEEIADYLLANGVYVLPCKIGDYIEWDTGFEKQLHQIRGFYLDQHRMLRFSCKDFAPIVGHCNILRTIPREEAEAKLKEGEKQVNTFVKAFSGSPDNSLEKQINDFAKERELEIINVSVVIERLTVVALVVFRKKGGAE
jgi:hypothetical protein